MELVQPIRDKEKIEEMKTELLKQGYRDYLFFLVGINTGLRISDILKLKVGDVKNKSHVNVVEQKTGKRNKIFINQTLHEAFNEYTKHMTDDDWLFPSRKGDKPITRTQAYRVLQRGAKVVGLEEIGTHTLRKTFGYHYYQSTKDIGMLQELFNHSYPSITMRYIGLNQDLKDEALRGFRL